MKFANQTAWVVGASSGIGRAVAVALAKEGTWVVAMGRNERLLKQLQAVCVPKGCRIQYRVVDVMEGNWGFDPPPNPDILVTAQAAPVLARPVTEITSGEWQKVIATDLSGTFEMVRMALLSMLPKKHGRIVCFSSIHAHASAPNRSAYATAKAGVEGFVRAVATEVGPHGVTINAIAPGFTATERTKGALRDAKIARMVQRIPVTYRTHDDNLGRMATVDEIVDGVLFLLGNGYTNGTTLTIDGGLTRTIQA